MYEELISDLRYCANKGESCGLCNHYEDGLLCLDNMVIQAADAIEELSEYHWIPVTERLPDCFYGEEIGNVEWISHGTVYAGCFGSGGKFRNAYFRVWNDATEGIDAINAEYWRFVLLPKLPKEKT